MPTPRSILGCPIRIRSDSPAREGPQVASVFLGLGLLLLSLVTPTHTLAQPRSALPEVTVRGGFKLPLTEANRRVALVSGQEAKPALLAGQLSVTGFRLETYRYQPDQQVDLIVESPTALFDSAKSAASSPGTLTLRGPNDRFTVSGEGWSWDQAGGLLIISNQVRTVLRRPGAASNQPPVEITARRLEYNLKTGDTRFQDHCIAHQPGRARLSAGELTSRLGSEVERPDAIRARNQVVIELLRAGREARASGETAEYQATPQGEAIELNGHPTWESTSVSGSADRLTLFPDREAYSAHGNARLRLLGNVGKNAENPATGASRLRRPIDIACDSIEARPGEVVFSGGVTATQTNTLELKADRVVAEFAPGTTAAPESLHLITATGHVLSQIALARRWVELRGERMTYAVGEHPRIEVTEHPSWIAEGHRGQGQRFVILPDQTAFHVLGEVQVEWRSPTGPTNAPPIRLQAGTLRFEGSDAKFSDGVTVSQPEWNLRGAELDLALTTNSQLRTLHVRKDVQLSFLARTSHTNTHAPHRIGTAAAAPGASNRWTVVADSAQAELEPGRDTIVALDAAGRVKIENTGVRATGGLLKYRAAEGVLRLTQDAELTTSEGLIIVGEPNTAIGFEPETGRQRVEGPVKRMSIPSQTVRSVPPKS
ncbi:MAG: hypothetical protein JNK85_26190 [Verrucomicrobiales bacterium]|nr:hypothetical protein [Verrucomicrobiales bacterium]